MDDLITLEELNSDIQEMELSTTLSYDEMHYIMMNEMDMSYDQDAIYYGDK